MWLIDLLTGKPFNRLAKQLEDGAVKRLEDAVVKSEAAMTAAREVSQELRVAKREEKKAQGDLDEVMRQLAERLADDEANRQ